MVALVLADAVIEKFGGDSMAELEAASGRWTAAIASHFD
jgi:hypothetical protein